MHAGRCRRACVLPQRIAGFGQFDAQSATILLVRHAAQVTLALQLVQLARHRATVQLHRSGQFGRRHGPQLLQTS